MNMSQNNNQPNPDWEGFAKHIEATEESGCPIGYDDLVRIAIQYNVPYPTREEMLDTDVDIKKL